MAGIEDMKEMSSPENMIESVETAPKAAMESPRPPGIHARGDHTYGVPQNDDSNSMPPGWSKKVTQRLNGKSAGKFDVYIYSPEGKKFRSRLELAAHVAVKKIDLNLDDFDFTVRGKGSPAKGAPLGQGKKATVSRKAKNPVKNKTKPKKPSPVKPAKAFPEKLVVKMKFSTPPKSRGRQRRSSGKSSEKKGRKGSLKRSVSESAVVKGRGKTVKPHQKLKPPVKRSISVTVKQASPDKNLTPGKRRASRGDNSSPRKSLSPGVSVSPVLERNNNDVNWTANKESEQTLGKRSSSCLSPTIRPLASSPNKLSRSDSDSQQTSVTVSPRTRRLSAQTNASSTGEELTLSKRRKLSEHS